VVFEPTRRLPPTARALLGALAMVLAPVVALTWNAASIPPHLVLGVLVPAYASYWTWIRLAHVALAWSRIAPLRSRLVVERVTQEPPREGEGPPYRGTASADARAKHSYLARAGTKSIGPDARRGVVQIRAYPGADLRLDQESPRATGPESPPMREMLVANVLVVGEEAMMMSYALLPRSSEAWHWLEYQDSAEAMAKGDGTPITFAPGSMRPLVQATIRVFGSESSESPLVPTIVWKDTPTVVDLVLLLVVNAPLRLGAYMWMSVHASDAGLGALARLEMSLTCMLTLLVVEATLYVVAMRSRYVGPLDSWVTMALRDHSRE
jgi:hypothetical protein